MDVMSRGEAIKFVVGTRVVGAHAPAVETLSSGSPFSYVILDFSYSTPRAASNLIRTSG